MCNTDDLSLSILAVRQSDDVQHIFIGGNKDKGHVTTRGVDCPCEPEVHVVNVKGERVRLMLHDYKVPSCR